MASSPRMAGKKVSPEKAIMITNQGVNKMNKFDQLITKAKLFTLEQQEWYLRNFRIGTETRSYIFECFELNMIKIFGDDECARDIIEELR